MSNLETLKAQVEAARIAAETKAKEALETAKLTAELSLLQNDAYQNALVAQTIREEATKKLAELNMQCESIVEASPVMDMRKRQNRQWNPSRRYGFGNHIAELVGLLTGIQYSVEEHRTLMLAVTGLSPDLIESTIDAYGQLPYYSSVHDIVVEGVTADAAKARELTQLVASHLGIQIDVSKLTQANFDKQHNMALIRAEADKAAAEKAESLQLQASLLMK